MSKLLESVTCPEQYPDNPVYHIPDYPGSDTTLCGLSDVPHITHDATETGITCNLCLAVVKWCKNLKIPKQKGGAV